MYPARNCTWPRKTAHKTAHRTAHYLWHAIFVESILSRSMSCDEKTAHGLRKLHIVFWFGVVLNEKGLVFVVFGFLFHLALLAGVLPFTRLVPMSLDYRCPNPPI